MAVVVDLPLVHAERLLQQPAAAACGRLQHLAGCNIALVWTHMACTGYALPSLTCAVDCLLHVLQQGNARKSVLAFASKESVDLLIIGMYRPTTRRKGLAVRGNAAIVANRCATQASARG